MLPFFFWQPPTEQGSIIDLMETLQFLKPQCTCGAAAIPAGGTGLCSVLIVLLVCFVVFKDKTNIEGIHDLKAGGQHFIWHFSKPRTSTCYVLCSLIKASQNHSRGYMRKDISSALQRSEAGFNVQQQRTLRVMQLTEIS